MGALTTRAIGNAAEQLACRYLTERGLKLLEANYTKKVGEIDLIMRDDQYTVFVEVRYRKHTDHGGSLKSITRGKQRKIAKTALCYLQEQDDIEMPCRFDVVAIEQANEIEWIQDAFSL